ncbi:hypothetical protein IJ472_06155 [bacterium]|nr:hypothetical protein [bacterium]
MNESIIKEIKSIYSARIKSNNPAHITPEIKAIKPEHKSNKTFFNGVIDKLNIIVEKNNKN